MFKMLRFLIVLILFVGGIGVVMFQIIRFLGMTRWSSSRKKRERVQGQQLASEILDNPVKWSLGEYDLLSQYYTYSRKRGVFSSTTEGILSTIYSEDFISFVIKQYHANEWLVSLATDSDRYSLYKSGKKAQIWKGDERIGWYINGQVLGQKEQVIGELRPGSAYHTMVIDGEDVAHVDSYDEEANINKRAFQLVREEKIKRDHEWIFTALVVMFLLESEILKS